jgi:cold-inducible RNA-binding protein
MEKRLFVAGLPFSFTDRELADLFAEFGVVNASVITDRETGRSKGFGFVELDTPEAAKAAIEKMNGAKAGDRSIIVNLARPKEDRPRRDFGGGNRGGGGGRDFGRRDGYNKNRGGFGGRRDSR